MEERAKEWAATGEPMLSPVHLRTFAAVADTLVARLDGEGTLWSSSASDLGLPNRLPALFRRLPGPKVQADLVRLLGLLETAAGGLLLYRRPRGFTSLSAAGRERALRRMATSRLPLARQAFQVLKRLTGLLLTTGDEDHPFNPVWPDLGYPGPLTPPEPAPERIRTVEVRDPSTWTSDVVVVGSGAGGATAAAVLAQAGLDVVVLERGPYVNEAGFSHLEWEAYRDLYQGANLGTTEDLGVILLAGSCLGGGTVVNYTASFAPPDQVREEWDRVAGFRDVFTGPEFDASVGEALSRLDVNTEHSTPSVRDELMEKGLARRGWHVGTIPRNVRGCPQDDACGYCTMGCRRGAKRSALRTWLEDAAQAGARLVVRAEVSRVLVEKGRASGVEASVAGVPFTVRSRAVVLACGGLNTPALLLRSGLGGPATGRFLHLHPATAVWGRYPERLVRPWSGTLQARFSDQFADLDGQGYGVKFETTAAHPALPTVFFGWSEPAGFKRRLLDYPHWSFVGILLRDRTVGRVRLGRDGYPVWSYRLRAEDKAHVATGIRGAAEVLAEAGADEVMASTAVPVTWRLGGGDGVDSFMGRVASVGLGSNQMAYASFHQMGSARMGADRRRAVVGEENEVHGTPGLFVMDASCFPTASGLNPMIAIAAIAHRGARALAARLGS